MKKQINWEEQENATIRVKATTARIKRWGLRIDSTLAKRMTRILNEIQKPLRGE